MSFESKVIQALKKEEDFRDRPYNDATDRPIALIHGKITIGYGRNLSDVPLTEEEGGYLLNNDIAVARQGCLRLLPSFDSLEENRKVGLLSLVFNLGESKLWSEFGETLALLRANDWSGVERHLRASLWARQVGERADEVIAMLCHNEYPFPQEGA